jgi:hypothetical protein
MKPTVMSSYVKGSCAATFADHAAATVATVSSAIPVRANDLVVITWFPP